MKLYATVTSERASKGQGGNEYINIDLMRGSAKDSVKCYRIHLTERSIALLKGEQVIFQELATTKGEKQKGECEHEWSDEVPNTGKQFCETCGATRTK